MEIPTNEIVLRSELDAFREEMRSDMRMVRDGHVEMRVRMDGNDRRLEALERNLTEGFRSIPSEIKSLSERFKKSQSFSSRFAQGVAAGLGAGYAIYQTIMALPHH